MPNPSILAAEEEGCQLGNQPPPCVSEPGATRGEVLEEVIGNLAKDLVDAHELLAEKDRTIEQLSGSLSQLGKRSLELEEERNRIQACNADTVKQYVIMRAIADAAARVHKAGIAYEQAETEMFYGEGQPSIPDAVVHECADSSADLEQLLVNAGLIKV
jgi:hypothetical protein